MGLGSLAEELIAITIHSPLCNFKNIICLLLMWSLQSLSFKSQLENQFVHCLNWLNENTSLYSTPWGKINVSLLLHSPPAKSIPKKSQVCLLKAENVCATPFACGSVQNMSLPNVTDVQRLILPAWFLAILGILEGKMPGLEMMLLGVSSSLATMVTSGSYWTYWLPTLGPELLLWAWTCCHEIKMFHCQHGRIYLMLFGACFSVCCWAGLP